MNVERRLPDVRLLDDVPGGFGRRGVVRAVGRSVGIVVWVVISLLSAPPAHRLVLGLLVGAGGAAVIATGFLRRRQLIGLVGVVIFIVSGFVLMATAYRSLGWVPPIFGVFWAIARLPGRVPAWIAGTTLVGLVVVATWTLGPGAALGLVGSCMGAGVLAYSIRTARRRAADAERLLASERSAREATARAEVLAERQRLAREIHDILAHTLSAQVVQLEGARMLLIRRADPDVVLERVERAQRLARDGLAETRQALESLRGRTRPVDETVRGLAADSDARFRQEGSVRDLAPEVSVAVARTVQEALTNARKHAPGARITVALRYGDADCGVEIRDAGSAGSPGPLATTGGGYGLAGMRERAELLGGTLLAGPCADGGFQVSLRLPG